MRTGQTTGFSAREAPRSKSRSMGAGSRPHTLPTLAAQYGMFKAKDSGEWFCQNCFKIEQQKFIEAEKNKHAQKEYDETVRNEQRDDLSEISDAMN